MGQLKANRRKETSVQCDGAVHGQAALADVENDAAAVVAQIDVGERVQPSARETAPFVGKDAGASALWFIRQKGTNTKGKPRMFWRADYTPGGQVSSEKFAKGGDPGVRRAWNAGERTKAAASTAPAGRLLEESTATRAEADGTRPSKGGRDGAIIGK